MDATRRTTKALFSPLGEAGPFSGATKPRKKARLGGTVPEGGLFPAPGHFGARSLSNPLCVTSSNTRCTSADGSRVSLLTTTTDNRLRKKAGRSS